MGKRVWRALIPVTTLCWFGLAVSVWAQGSEPSSLDPVFWSALLAWLVPIGLCMLACGTVPPERVPAVMRAGWLALGLSVVGYWLCGFAFQFGGVGFVSEHPELAGLAREWTLSGLESAWGSQWGVIGLEGYMLRGAAGMPAALRLFWTQLPWITTCVALLLWSVQGRAWPIRSGAHQTAGMGVLLALLGLLQAAVYALIGNWAWGGGWLASLGLNLGLGQGFVDVGGSWVHLAAAASALAAMVALPARRLGRAAARPDVQQLALPTLGDPGSGAQVRWTARDEPYVPMPTLHLPVLATAGAWLAVLGWVGWIGSAPHLATAAAAGGVAVQHGIGLLLAAGAGALSALFSSWLATGEGNALMTARGVIGALIAVSAGLSFYPLWAVLAIGAAAGLLVPLAQYAADHWFRIEDATSALAVHGMCALWGLLAVGLFAGGPAADWPGQFQAQAFGVAAIGGCALLASGLVVGLSRRLARAWVGEAAPQRTIRPSRSARARRASGRRIVRTLAGAVQAWMPDWLRQRLAGPAQASGAAEEGDLAEPESLADELTDAGLESFDVAEPPFVETGIPADDAETPAEDVN